MILDQTQQVIDLIFDCDVLRHGFRDYMRDYELLIDNRGPGPGTEEHPDGFRVLFRHCVWAEVRSVVAPETWRRSLGDEQLEMATAREDREHHKVGFVWGVRHQFCYPGGRIIDRSAQAAEWTAAIGIVFEEVQIDCSVHRIRLVYSGIRAEPWDPATLEAERRGA